MWSCSHCYGPLSENEPLPKSPNPLFHMLSTKIEPLCYLYIMAVGEFSKPPVTPTLWAPCEAFQHRLIRKLVYLSLTGVRIKKDFYCVWQESALTALSYTHFVYSVPTVIVCKTKLFSVCLSCILSGGWGLKTDSHSALLFAIKEFTSSIQHYLENVFLNLDGKIFCCTYWCYCNM